MTSADPSWKVDETESPGEEEADELVSYEILTLANDVKLTNLISNSQKNVLSRVKKTDIAECAALFGNDVRDAFNAAITPQDVTLYGNIVTQRHAVAHSEDGQLVDWTTATLSLGDVELGLAAAERVMAAFEAAIQ
ncbi:MAG TPA: hypothetical protein VM144_09215 [Aestuariivirga sp.]|nr:hypothetical protein [Aestuariivirga sp.]